MKKIRTPVKGQTIDLDLLRLKSQLITPPSEDVKKRQEYIEKKLKRYLNRIKKKQEIDENVSIEETQTDNEQQEEQITEEKEKQENKKVKKKVKKQKAKPVKKEKADEQESKDT